MTTEFARRRLVSHGILLFLLGLVAGMFVQSVRNPRMALSADVGTVMSGIFLALSGSAWRDVRLSAQSGALWGLRARALAT